MRTGEHSTRRNPVRRSRKSLNRSSLNFLEPLVGITPPTYSNHTFLSRYKWKTIYQDENLYLTYDVGP